MLSQFRNAFVITILLSLIITVPVLAGGWAVITLDDLPSNVVAGEPLAIGFTVLQHGRTPMPGLDPTVTATSSGGETFVVNAEPEGKPGHYAATLTFPKEGEWNWSIKAFTMDQKMPTLSVAAPGTETVNPSVVETEPGTGSFSPLVIVRILAFVVGLIGLVLAFRRKSRVALAITVVAISVGLASFLIGSAVLKAEAQSKEVSAVSIKSSASQIELGRRLFVAKGCITCHHNDRAASRSDYWTIEMGAPDLSNYSSVREILFIRLKDPSTAKSDTNMPNLNLKKTEIEALVEFINSK